MARRLEDITIVILPESEAAGYSVRVALRCLQRDLRLLGYAVWKHIRRYVGVFNRGYAAVNQRWAHVQNRLENK